MNRRRFCLLCAAIAIPGCSSLRDGGVRDVDVSVQNEGWTQFRGGSGRAGYANQQFSLDTGATIETVAIPTELSPIPTERGLIAPASDGIQLISSDGSANRGLLSIESQTAATPARCSSILVIPTSDSLVGYDVDADSTIWEVPIGHLNSPPIAFASHFLVPTTDTVSLRDARTGERLWTSEIGSGIRGYAANENRVVVSQYTGSESRLKALDVATGDQQWTTTVETSRLSPVVTDDTTFSISRFGRLTYVRDGTSEARIETDVPNPELLSISEDIALIGPGVDGRYAGVDLSAQKVVWRRQIEFGGFPFVTEREAFVPAANDGLLVVDLQTGETKQAFPDVKLKSEAIPATDGIVCFGGPDNEVQIVRADSSVDQRSR